MPPPPYFFSYTRLDVVIPFSATGLVPDAHVSLSFPWAAAIALGSVLLYAHLIFSRWPRMYARQRELCAAKAAVPEPAWAFAHHAALFAYSAFACCAAALHVAAAGELSLAAFACTPLPAWLRLVSITFTLSKLWEWLDTAVLFARGGSVGSIGFLHCYHHATTFLLFLVIQNFPGAEKSGMLLNGFVHTLMYAHYAWRLPRWARPLITGAQIVQLAAVTALWAATPALCGGAPAAFARDNPASFLTPFVRRGQLVFRLALSLSARAPLTSPSPTPRPPPFRAQALVPVYLLAFLEFFARAYCCPPKKSKESGD